MTSTMFQTLFKGRPVRGNVTVTGGVSQNCQVRRWMQELAPEARFRFPEGGHLAVALGAALLASEDAGLVPVTMDELARDLVPFIEKAHGGNGSTSASNGDYGPLELRLSTYPSFDVVRSYTDANGTEVRITRWGEAGGTVSCHMGIDIGSTSTKAVLLDESGEVLAGARGTQGRGWARTMDALLAGVDPTRVIAGSATTIGVVATDARLNKAQATQLANLAHHGLSRAISPLTANDGDSLFALATGTVGTPVELSGLGSVAAEVVSRAIRNAVRAARSLQAPDLPAAVDGPGDRHSGG